MNFSNLPKRANKCSPVPNLRPHPSVMLLMLPPPCLYISLQSILLFSCVHGMTLPIAAAIKRGWQLYKKNRQFVFVYNMQKDKSHWNRVRQPPNVLMLQTFAFRLRFLLFFGSRTKICAPVLNYSAFMWTVVSDLRSAHIMSHEVNDQKWNQAFASTTERARRERERDRERANG